MAGGFLPLAEMLHLAEGNIIFDPFSTLISRFAQIGTGNVFHPCVTLIARAEAPLTIGDGNVLHTGTLLAAEAGPIVIGDSNQFGEGGFTAKANRIGAAIAIGSGGRYLGGAAVFGQSELGAGSQILGLITVDNCVLEAGETYASPDPDERGAVLKGSGTARDVKVGRGEVILGAGSFRQQEIRKQSDFHPKRPS
jgi:NDP-sugar pyrophosphorylase family protein